MGTLDYIKSKGLGVDSVVHKFGKGAVAGSAPSDIVIWDGLPNTYTYIDPVVPVTLFASSSDTGDEQVVEVQGLDANWEMQTAYVTLNGRTPVVMNNTLWIRVFRAINRGTTNFAGDIYIAESDVYTNGVPDTPAKWKAKITIGFNQTLMAMYTVPVGKIGYISNFYSTIYQIGSNPAQTEKAGVQCLRIRPNGEVFQSKVVHDISNTNLHMKHHYNIPLLVGSQVDIELAVFNIDDDTTVSGGFEILLCV